MNSKADIIFEMFERRLSEHYKTKSIRTSQVQMAMDIAKFVLSSTQEKIMFVEAPVGTGKSLGALIPTLVEADFEQFQKRNIVYATATINLQGQLMNSEVPLLKNCHW